MEAWISGNGLSAKIGMSDSGVESTARSDSLLPTVVRRQSRKRTLMGGCPPTNDENGSDQSLFSEQIGRRKVT